MTLDLDTISPRPIQDVAEMAVAVQANLVQLRVALNKRCGSDTVDVRTPAPGVVKRFRETLLDADQIARYDEPALTLRLREVWGQHCLFCWFFGAADPQDPPAYRDLATSAQLRCPQAVAIKVLEIEKSLWRCKFERRLRHDRDFRQHPRFDEYHRTAERIPVQALGSQIRICADGELLAATCEFAGMLAAGRWMADDRWAWGQDGIMDVHDD